VSGATSLEVKKDNRIEKGNPRYQPIPSAVTACYRLSLKNHQRKKRKVIKINTGNVSARGHGFSLLMSIAKCSNTSN
jgi:hypothetical protein